MLIQSVIKQTKHFKGIGSGLFPLPQTAGVSMVSVANPGDGGVTTILSKGQLGFL